MMKEARAWFRERWLESVLLLGFAAIIVWFGYIAAPTVKRYLPESFSRDFDGRAAYRHVIAQVEIGPRVTGTEGSQKAQQYMIERLAKHGWKIELQAFVYRGYRATNIIAKAGEGKGPIILVGAHYDTRRRADSDPDEQKRNMPVPGANDGASGVAVLLELARALDKTHLENEVWLVFFDAEDNGGLDTWQFIQGSTYFADNLVTHPGAVIIVDMIGDADQQLFKEQNSTPWLVEQVWAKAAALGYDQYFLPDAKYSMLDDHTPFLRKGIPAIDIIDFDYPYWHTTEDTPEKVSGASLARVGRVIESLLEDAEIKLDGGQDIP